MRRLFKRHRSLYPIRSCHFCCIESWIIPPHPLDTEDGTTNNNLTTSIPSCSDGPQISSGSVSNWFCSSCECWNRSDASQVGGIATWEQKMSNNQQNIDSFQKRAISTSSSSLSISSLSSRFPTTSPFCHSCQTNQTLILSILANGDTDGMDDDAIQDWQSSLQARYPPVCDQCRMMVIDRIDTADKMARRLIWNGWLRKSREIGVISSPRRDAAGQGNLEELKVDSMRSWSGIFWVMQCIAFALGFVVDMVAIWRRPNIESKEQIISFVTLLASHQLALSWDPTLPRQLRIRRRLSPGSILKVKGLNKLHLVKYGLLGIRLLDLSSLIDLTLPVGLIRDSRYISVVTFRHVFTGLTLLFQWGITINAFASLCVVEPLSFSLKSRKGNSESSIKVDDHTSNRDPALNLLSLDSNMHFGAQQEQSTSSIIDYGKSSIAGTKSEEMDWSPTPDVNISRVGDDFQLGPQHFFEPIQRTGLEELLHLQLALGEEKAVVKKKKPKNQISPRAIAGSVLAATTVLVIFVSIKLGPIEIKAALDQLAVHYIPLRLQQLGEKVNV